MTLLIGWVLAYVCVGLLAVIVVLLKMAMLSREDTFFALSIAVGWPVFLAAVAAHRMWTRFGPGRRRP